MFKRIHISPIQTLLHKRTAPEVLWMVIESLTRVNHCSVCSDYRYMSSLMTGWIMWWVGTNDS